MTNIPFPNPHDADALNRYLDDLAAGKQATPGDDVQQAAAEMQSLAQQSVPIIPDTKSRNQPGGNQMQTTAYSPPISNRTRRSQSPARKEPRRQTWLSIGLVAAMLLSVVGYGFWNGSGGSDENDNIAWAPQTASPIAQTGMVWTAPISPSECPDDAIPNRYDPENPGGTSYNLADYENVSSERSYDIVGPADPDDANEVVTKIRESYGCIAMGKTIPLVTVRHEYENRTTAGRESLESISQQRTEASAAVSSWLETELGLTPVDMYVFQDPEMIDLDGNEALVTQGLYSPDYAVLFADGRIGVIPSAVSYSEIQVEISHKTVPGYGPNLIIFAYQDGEWLIDESLPICLGDCELSPDGTPVVGGDSSATPAATPEQ